MSVFPPDTFVTWPQRGSPVSVSTWLREVGGFVRASAAPLQFPEDAACGHGEPVIVVPGFCSPDISTANLRRFLARQGFSVRSWDCGLNLGPANDAIERLEGRVRERAERHAHKVSLVGVSLGGTLAREAAKRCPGFVERVVTLASPINLPVATPLAPVARLVSVLWDKDAQDAIGRIRQAPPVPVTAIVSPGDGVIDWHACIPEPSPLVELVMIAGAHMTMGSNPDAQRIVAARLASPTSGIGVE